MPGSDASVSDTSSDSLEIERLVEISDVTNASIEERDPGLVTPMGSNLSGDGNDSPASEKKHTSNKAYPWLSLM